jgi:serine/threonine-protein kinase BUR1
MPLGGCGSVKEYDLVCRVGEGTYGTVFKARHLKTGQLYALKKVILHNEESDGVRCG